MSHLLQKAAEQGDVAALRRLLDAGADIEWQHKGTGRTALVSATIAGHHDAVVALLDRGANIDHACKAMGYTALTWAASQGTTDIAMQLTARGAALDQASPDMRRTALMAASQAGHAGIVGHLLERGANPRLMDFSQQTAWSLADENGHVATLAVLEAAGVGAPPPPVEPPSLPWPDIEAGIAATAEPVRVVRAYLLAVYDWETAGHARQADAQTPVPDAFWAGADDIVSAYCTARKRVVTRKGFGWPPEFTPAVSLISATQAGAGAEVVICDPVETANLRYEHLFVVKRVSGEWRIDSMKRRLHGIGKWENGLL